MTNSVYFESKTIDKDFIISGNLSGFFNISINKKDFDTDTYLYQIKSEGKAFLLSTHIARASYAKDHSVRQLLKPGKDEQIPIHNSIFISKKIEKGSKLVLLVGANKNPSWQINYGTVRM
ncbi:hypothetical protein MP477_03305 [Chryseobacterium sp. WG23]|uniref:CocE/NonD family hydrolase C-terminal non-catalytic domain-containing protein n=1 Tax=Chryseobacterium sp. WG23 TaxID=2926910 RepID=UPI00211DFFCE|nr:CocE/NonD family hydrolase C-terminal non-catalytic domain-containing protein [Chryseobacterium sp. WG23]MCQ9633977.1 hypothetical protein [Chryseobacterium sp. WG23]